MLGFIAITGAAAVAAGVWQAGGLVPETGRRLRARPLGDRFAGPRGGGRIRLDPFASPAANIFGIRSGIVQGRREFTDLSGRTHSAWLLENGGNPASPRMGRIYLIEHPPYFLARFSVDLDSGEETRGVRLRRFQYLD